MKKIAIIRSGAQTGADRGGLDAARECGVPIAGWCPKGGLAEDHENDRGLLEAYPELVETPSDGYEQRTEWNVRDSHATLIVAPNDIEPGSGTEMTVNFARQYGRPVLVVTGEDEIAAAREWLRGMGQGLTLNIAGPRGSKLASAYDVAKAVVTGLLTADKDIPW